jgi:hypothetical protein
MIGFLMLTGASVETARNLHRTQVDLSNRSWSDERCCPWDLPQRWKPLSRECVRLLSLVPEPKEYFFPSPRKRAFRAIVLRRSVLRRLQVLSGVESWGWRELVKSVRLNLQATSTRITDDVRTDPDAWAELLLGAGVRTTESLDDDVVL